MRYFIYCRKSSESEDRQVLSLDSQETEVRKAFDNSPDIEVVQVIKEARSAKEPGRPMFDDMLRRIERREADGIIAYHPDRLARNSIDGGRIIFLLDRKLLLDLKFSTLSFENNPTGKFMLNILFGQSKYYVDNLSENVKRGNRAKLALGWMPNHPAIGYKNDAGTKTIVIDPERFTLVRQLFELALTGTYSLRRLAEEARALGLKTIKRKRSGGKFLSVGNIHHMLTNPFYAGVVRWNGQSYPGAHPPMITNEEFALIGKRLSRKLDKLPKQKKVLFPFKGLMRCRECGLSITAETKVNRYGYRYTYYHCTKKRSDYVCRQRSISGTALHDTYVGFIENHTVPKTLYAWTLRKIRAGRERSEGGRESQQRALQAAFADTKRQLSKLWKHRLEGSIPDDEFTIQQSTLLKEQEQITNDLARIEKTGQWFEPAESVFSFNDRALFWYTLGDNEAKWQIARIMSSNLLLKDKNVSIEAADPFILLKKKANRTMLCAALDRIRTLYESGDKDFLQALSTIKHLEGRFRNEAEPQTGA